MRVQRITPACAGKRKSRRPVLGSVQDHPRVCGEKGGDHRHRCNTKGSPPRVRGKAGTAGQDGHSPGITPACAGKSIFRLRVENVR